jgi:hypothetical protein
MSHLLGFIFLFEPESGCNFLQLSFFMKFFSKSVIFVLDLGLVISLGDINGEEHGNAHKNPILVQSFILFLSYRKPIQR